MKPARDIEVGDRITRTRNGKPEAVLTVTAVLSRRGGLRRVRVDIVDEFTLRIDAEGGVCAESDDKFSTLGYRRELPGDARACAEAAERAALFDRVRYARLDTWPIEDVRRVLAAWPGEKR